MFHIRMGSFWMSLKKHPLVFLVLCFGRFSQEGPAFRCPESVALAADFEREGAEVFWVEAGLIWEGVGRVGMFIYIYIYRPKGGGETAKLESGVFCCLNFFLLYSISHTIPEIGILTCI